MIKITVLFSFFLASFAYAHPNHMSFENVQHDGEQKTGITNENVKITHRAEENIQHSDVIHCAEQHKVVPCKKK